MTDLNIETEAAVALTQKVGTHVIDRSEISTTESRKRQVRIHSRNCDSGLDLEFGCFPLQFYATLFATLGCFLNGGIIGYTGPANPSLMDPKGVDIYGNPYSADLQTISWISKFDLAPERAIRELLIGQICE